MIPSFFFCLSNLSNTSVMNKPYVTQLQIFDKNLKKFLFRVYKFKKNISYTHIQIIYLFVFTMKPLFYQE